MSRITPAAPETLPAEMRESLAYAESLMGFVANDVLTMANWPEFLAAVRSVVSVVYAPGQLDAGLKRLVAHVVSHAAGCTYCQAHTAHGAVELAGVDADKFRAVWSFETDDRFSEAERAALRLAMAAGSVPNESTDAHFVALREHFGERAIMELMGVISLFGLLNRWNQTLATTLEAKPAAFVSHHANEAV
ncbi:MAG: carboxymuconolactone decarboxylase family protein [Pseudomonadota bacterium]